MVAAATYPSQILMKHANYEYSGEKTKGQPSDFTCTQTQKKQYDDTIIITSPTNLHSYNSLACKLEELPNHTLVFNVEETLLKSSSWFPFFMLVAFEGGGGLLRALLLLLSYPFLCLVDDDWKLKIMIFVSFFGIKKTTFRIGRTVLPKFFMEDVGYEAFELVMRFGKRVGVSNFPTVMVQGFLNDYLRIETVLGKELKVFGGYYLGVLQDKEEVDKEILDKIFKEENIMKSQIIGMASFGRTINQHFFNRCKEIYLVNEGDKEKWHFLPRDKYPNPLIFHDGRLAFLPTPLASLAMFIWLPFGVLLCILRLIIVVFLPNKLSIPIMTFLGVSGVRSKYYSQKNNSTDQNNSKGLIYVCNHKTLLDPIYISYYCRVPLTALTYSISKSSHIISPIKTVTLTRDRERDAEIMREMLNKGSIVVCPEGTTCREPYLLRFSPLFAKISDDIIPVALEVKFSMFHGTTASGIKALDPIFFLLNPFPFYSVNFLEKLPKAHTCRASGISEIDVANYVQAEIGKALKYKCTCWTRRDKYIMLAGNNGVFKRL